MKNYFAAAAAALLVVVGLSASTGSAATAVSTNTPDVQGAIRCTNGQYDVISDSGHTPRGITNVVTGTDRITVYYTPMATVGSMQATADETYVINDYAVGASVGTDRVVLFLAKGGVKVSPASACLAYSNIWLTGWAG
jgi:hypothetical protein